MKITRVHRAQYDLEYKEYVIKFLCAVRSIHIKHKDHMVDRLNTTKPECLQCGQKYPKELVGITKLLAPMYFNHYDNERRLE